MAASSGVKIQKTMPRSFLRSPVAEFCCDLRAASKSASYSWLAALYEIKARYATSMLGPLWMVMSNVVFIAVVGLIYSSVFGVQVSEYLPYLATGYLLWTLMIAVFLHTAEYFSYYAGTILRDNHISPMLIYGRTFCRSLIIFAHNVPLIFGLVIYYKGFVVDVPNLILGFSLFLTTTFFLGLISVTMASRFRDIYYAMPSIFQVLTLVMPILWKPDMINGRGELMLDLNLLYQLLEIVRAPILGQVVPFNYYLNCTLLLVGSFFFAAYFYEGSKRKFVYWLVKGS